MVNPADKLVRPPQGTDPPAHRKRDPRYVYKLAAFVSLGALLFGYDQGVMGVIVADQRFKDLMRPKNSCMLGVGQAKSSCYLP